MLNKIDNAIVGFVDILGFKSLVRAPGNRVKNAKKLDVAIRNALEWFGGYEAFKDTIESEWQIKIFSDCLCVSKPATEMGMVVVLNALSGFIKEMLYAGFPVRGAITIGEHLESEYMIFSPAQIEAYEIEQVQAIYPRVLISQKIVEYINSIRDDDMRMLAKEYAVIDEDANTFVNYLVFEYNDSWLSGHNFYLTLKKYIEQNMLLNAQDKYTLNKYIWMAKYHNWSLHYTAKVLKNTDVLCEDDIWSFSALLIRNVTYKSKFRCLLWDDDVYKKLFGEDRFSESPAIYKYYIRKNENVDWIKTTEARTEDDEPDDFI